MSADSETTATRKLCPVCQKRRASEPRKGLCDYCYKTRPECRLPRRKRTRVDMENSCPQCADRVGHAQWRGWCQRCWNRYPSQRPPKEPPQEPCIHCGQGEVRTCGLCCRCLRNKDVRAKYALAASPIEYIRRGARAALAIVAEHKIPALPAQPTRYKPGTLEKIKVMRLRASKGEALFHPKDRK